MKSNQDLQSEVQEATQKEPLLNAAEIGVKAKDDVVSLKSIVVSVSRTTVTSTGMENSWYQKEEAEFLASKTPGILHVKNELEVEYLFYEGNNYSFMTNIKLS
jgi:osmotically-inducible protein OsmY